MINRAGVVLATPGTPPPLSCARWPPNSKPAASPMPDPAADKRSPVDAVDAALTGVGERLRDPSLQASARRTATHVAAAVSASAHAVSHRSRSDPETTDTVTDDLPDQKAANTEPEATQRAD